MIKNKIFSQSRNPLHKTNREIFTHFYYLLFFIIILFLIYFYFE